MKTLLLLAVCMLFTAGGTLMVLHGQPTGWLCAGFFALGIPVFLLQLHPRCSSLTVSEQGIEITALFRRSVMPWEDIAEFGTYTLRNGLAKTTMVGLNFAASYQKSSKARAVAKAMSGFEGGLPDTYGLRAEDLAQLLALIHEEVLTAPRRGPTPS